MSHATSDLDFISDNPRHAAALAAAELARSTSYGSIPPPPPESYHDTSKNPFIHSLKDENDLPPPPQEERHHSRLSARLSGHNSNLDETLEEDDEKRNEFTVAVHLDNETNPPPPPEDGDENQSHLMISVGSTIGMSSSSASKNLSISPTGSRGNNEHFVRTSVSEDFPPDLDDDAKTSASPFLSSSELLPSEKTFANCLSQNFDVVSAQVETGVYAAKRVASMIKKILLLQEEFAKGVQKVLAHEKTKLDKLAGDGMKTYGKTWGRVQDIFLSLSRTYEDDAKRVQTEIIQPLLDFYEDAESRRKDIKVEERKASGEMARAREEVSKSLAKCNILLKQCKSVQQEESANAAAQKNKAGGVKGMLKMMQKTFGKSSKDVQIDAAKAAKVYTQAITVANKRQERYIGQDLPKVFSSMQALEKERLESVKQKLLKYCAIEEKFAEDRRRIAETMTNSVNQLNADSDIQSFIENFVLENDLPTKILAFTYQLPCSPKDIEEGRLEGNPKSVFRSSLEKIMELQKSSAPTLEVPKILVTCIKAIKDLNGFKTEGIFRISVAKPELEALHKQIDNDDYNIKATSPHAPAALLKEWLRLLADPLIPVELYNETILLVKERESSPSEILRFFDKLSPIARKILEHLSAMAQVISNEENQKITKMTVENLAIVFAPSFLRSPSDDPLELLQNSKFEIKFTAALFRAVAPQATVKY